VSVTAEAVRDVPQPGGPRPISIRTDRSVQDQVYRVITSATGLGTLVLLFLIGLFLLLRGLPALRIEGFRFVTTSGFETIGKNLHFGVAASLFGTFVVATVALVVAVPVALATAIFLNEYAPERSRRFLTAVVDLGAAIPSVIYGLWGIFEFQPNLVGFCTWLSRHLAWIPFFEVTTPKVTASLFVAGMVVGLMIVPIIASVTREVFSLTPQGEREAALALGSSRFGMIRTVVIPFGRGGMIGAIMLGLGRALGETIAVVIILAESFVISPHILQTGGSTVAAFIAIHAESGGPTGTAALMLAGFTLFLFTMAVNLAASAIVSRSRSGAGVEL